MEMVFDDLDDFEAPDVSLEEETGDDTLEQNNPDDVQEIVDEPEIKDEPVVSSTPDVISELLKLQGITDKSKIQYENEDGEIEEVDWNTLPLEDLLNILRTQESNDTDLDDSEIELINAIRNSKMSPAEYLDNIGKASVDNYILNTNTVSYKVDQYSDDELFVYDMIARLGDNVTDEEVQEALDLAKQNPTLFNKLMEVMRKSYQQSEQEEYNQIEFEKQLVEQENYKQFSQTIANQINSFQDFYGCLVELEKDDKEELYEFITGLDAAGNNHFAKVLNDPELVVKMAWTVLNGEKLIEDINDYYKSEISKVRKTSYEKGLKDAEKKSNVFIKPNDKSSKTTNNTNYYDDLDDF